MQLQVAKFDRALKSRTENDFVKALYRTPTSSTRTGALFNAHSYPTKINVEAVVPFILAHTQPGDLVFDGFSGTGVTGLAAALCEQPDSDLVSIVQKYTDSPNWGRRRAVLYDISELATFISATLLDPPDSKEFACAANEILRSLENDLGWMYSSRSDNHEVGRVRFNIWTEWLICPKCGGQHRFWDIAVNLEAPAIAETATCPTCSFGFKLSNADRVIESQWDELIDSEVEQRKRTIAYVYGQSGKRFWRRPATEDDTELVQRVLEIPIPSSVPIYRMMNSTNNRWGELHRSGYHQGVTHLHHFYTRRNLIAIGAAWDLVAAYPNQLQNALKFWISSYNAAHSTLMTRVVCKQKAKDLVVTGAQPAALYISSIPVEKNVFAGLRTKLTPVQKAFGTLRGSGEGIRVSRASSLNIDLPDASVDYIFTDPPFGDNIQYSEVNFISEAWLGSPSINYAEEVIVSPSAGKSVADYEMMLKKAFSEFFRILRPDSFMTVVFHSAHSAVWEAIRKAWESAGFEVRHSSILDKTQASFKQTTTNGAVKGDPVILLYKPASSVSETVQHELDTLQIWDLLGERLASLDEDSEERDKQRLYTFVVRVALAQKRPVTFSAQQLFHDLDKHFIEREGKYYLR